MFFKVAGFELRYQLRHPVFWIGVVLFALLAFGSVASDNIHIGDTANVHKNAPFVIDRTTYFFGMLFMLVSTAFIANVVTRDDETGFGPMIRVTRIGKIDYLYGRYVGAFIAAAIGLMAIPLGLAIGSVMPWLDRETLGPFVPGHYLYAYGVIGLPVLFFTSSLFFVAATVTRSTMWTYVGVIAFLVLGFALRLLMQKPGLEHVSALWDPFGGSSIEYAARYWSPAERNANLPPLTGYVLWSRVIWCVIAVALLALAYLLYHTRNAPLRGRRRRAAALAAKAGGEPPAQVAVVKGSPSFGAATAWAQLWARTRLDAQQVFTSPAYFVLLGLAALLALLNLWGASDVGIYGVRTYPVTRLMINGLSGIFTFMAMIIAIFYAGELVWRERDRRTHEIVDAAPTPNWAYVFPKTVAIALVLISTMLVSVVLAMVMQLLQGFTQLEPGKYLLWWIVPQCVDLTLLACLAVFIQAVSPHKFVGWGIMVVYLVATIVATSLGFDHGLYNYGFSSDVPLSDMNGMGRFWIGAYWFRLYWAAFAGILLILANAFWPRGTETSFRARLRVLPHRLAGAPGTGLVLLLLLFASTGVYIYINTNVWNHYRTAQDEERWSADREKALWPYHDAPQPQVVDVRLDVDIRPDAPRVTTRGAYILQNLTSAPLREVHIRFPRDLVMRSLSIQGARPKTTLERFNYRIFAFDTPMQPGERRAVAFTTVLQERGFRNRGDLLKVVRNGTFVNDRDITPALGVDPSEFLSDRGKRRKYHLPVDRTRPPKLGTPGANQFSAIGVSGSFVHSDIRVTTDADQTPIAPGYKILDVVHGGRRTAEFRTEAPILDFFSIQSARYAVSTVDYKGVKISVFYHPPHAWNVARIQKTVEMSLDYYQANFSPYQFRQVRVLEFPQFQGSFAQSFANTIPWSEGLVFITDNRDPKRIDMVTYVGAHEVAHQWWAHQVIGANEQGGDMLAETFAQYSALMVMKHHYGPDMIRKFLKYELDSYLKARGGEAVEEVPLDRDEGQGYIHYRKGSLVMYRLQDEIGEGAVNAVLRKLIHDYAFKGAPFPTTLDFLRDLRAAAPADKQQLITDLFDRITLYDLKATKAVTHRRPDGQYETTLTISAAKFYATGQGKETSAPMNETVDLGLFTAEPGKPGFTAKNVVQLVKLPIRSGVQTLRLVSRTAPTQAGIDPYNMMVDRNSEDNLIKVEGR